MDFGPSLSVSRESGATVAASAKLIVQRAIRSDHEVSGRVMLAALVKVPELLPSILILLLAQTTPIFDHRHVSETHGRFGAGRQWSSRLDAAREHTAPITLVMAKVLSWLTFVRAPEIASMARARSGLVAS